jgi:hypothetical protein
LPSSRSERHEVFVLDEVSFEDIPRLSDDVKRAAAEVLRDLHFDPYLGDSLTPALRLDLGDCRKVCFDAPDEKGRERANKRYRLVYRNEPSDGSVAVVAIIAIGKKDNLQAYRRAAVRLGRGLSRRGRR